MRKTLRNATKSQKILINPMVIEVLKVVFIAILILGFLAYGFFLSLF